MSCFDGKSSTSLKELKGQSVNVEIQESGEFKNIKKFYEVSSGDVPVEVEKPGEQAATPRPRSKGEAFPTSMKVSYAKDCFCAMVTRISQSKFDEMSEEDIKKLMDTSITVIEMAMTKFS